MAPPALFALPFYQLYSAVGLFDKDRPAVAFSKLLYWVVEGPLVLGHERHQAARMPGMGRGIITMGKSRLLMVAGA